MVNQSNRPISSSVLDSLDDLDPDEEKRERDSLPTPVSCMASSTVLVGIGVVGAIGSYFASRYHLIEKSTEFFKEVLNYF